MSMQTMRDVVTEAARNGKATYLPAGARDNATAIVLIDGVNVGQASTLMHGVKIDPSDPASKTMFGECRLIPDEG